MHLVGEGLLSECSNFPCLHAATDHRLYQLAQARPHNVLHFLAGLNPHPV